MELAHRNRFRGSAAFFALLLAASAGVTPGRGAAAEGGAGEGNAAQAKDGSAAWSRMAVPRTGGQIAAAHRAEAASSKFSRRRVPWVQIFPAVPQAGLPASGLPSSGVMAGAQPSVGRIPAG